MTCTIRRPQSQSATECLPRRHSGSVLRATEVESSESVTEDVDHRLAHDLDNVLRVLSKHVKYNF